MCEIFEYVRGVAFVVVIFSINSCDNLYICIIYIFEFVVDNLYIYYFESVSCIQCIVIKPPSKIINFPLKKITIRVIESLGNFKFFLEDLFTFFKKSVLSLPRNKVLLKRDYIAIYTPIQSMIID